MKAEAEAEAVFRSEFPLSARREREASHPKPRSRSQ
jgi:hypothetical protein